MLYAVSYRNDEGIYNGEVQPFDEDKNTFDTMFESRHDARQCAHAVSLMADFVQQTYQSAINDCNAELQAFVDKICAGIEGDEVTKAAIATHAEKIKAEIDKSLKHVLGLESKNNDTKI